MANSKRNFIAGRMNKSVDERLIPNGEYVDAMNVRLGSTEDSEIGSVENSKGNTLLTDIILGVYSGTRYSLSNSAKCIGAFEDGARETIYWFIHDSNATDTVLNKADLIVSLNTNTLVTTYHVISFKNPNDVLNTTLNFNPQYLINNVNKVDDFLFFTDNYNPPRKINVTKQYQYPTTIAGEDDSTVYNDILVIKSPPTKSPSIQNLNTNVQDTFMEERFICFAYRYKYEDDEFSATSQWTSPSFIPKPFNLSIENYLNEGMVNNTNTAIITYNSGPSIVTGIEILFKEANSNIIKIIEEINKTQNGVVNDTDYEYTFTDSKIFTILSEGEILRLYDNVPLLANSQTLMGNRIMYGNYVEGYDLKDVNGNTSNINFYTSPILTAIGTEELNTTLDNALYSIDGSVTISNGSLSNSTNISGPLKKGSSLSLNFNLSHSEFSGTSTDPTETTFNISINWLYILPADFNNMFELTNSNDFQEKVGTASNIQTVANSCNGTTLTDLINCALPGTLGLYTKTSSGRSSIGQPVLLEGFSGLVDKIKFQPIAMKYVNGADIQFEYYKINNVSIIYSEISNPTSLHSNRGYEIGVVYMDEFNRATTALVSPDNTQYFNCSTSNTQNKIKVTIPFSPVMKAPSFAKRYKFVIKPDVESYETIYSNIYFTDPTDNATYFLLEGENIAKVEQGDRYIVKVDSSGAVGRCSYATVLEKKSQDSNFISPLDSLGVAIPVPSGLYMKILANDFSTILTDNATIFPGEQDSVEEATGVRASLSYNGFQLSIDGSGNYINFNVPAGSNIRMKFDMRRKGSGNSCEKRIYKLDVTLTASQDYDDIISWFNGDNVQNILDTGTKEVGNGPDIQNEYLPDLATVSSDISNFKQGLAGNPNGLSTNYYQWYKDATTSKIMFLVSGTLACGSSDKRESRVRARFEIYRADQTVVFETEPTDALPDVWYEGQNSYPITIDGYHESNITGDTNQTSSQDGIILLDFFNCFAFGNGVESFKVRDSIKGKSFSLGNRVTTVAEQDYKRAHRANDITYSGIYNDETNLNRLNEFNLGLLNFKPLEESFGPINKMFARETDILVLQEDKISYVLAGKNLLSDASGVSVLTSVPEVLGKQIARIEEFGISDNPESFVSYGANKFFTDSKRGALIQLKGNSGSAEQLTVISEVGMRGWFRDLFQDYFNTQKLGGYDPYMNEYVLSSNENKLPSEITCFPCGLRRTIKLGVAETVTYCVNLPDTVGPINIPYIVDSAGTFNITAVWNSTTATTGDVNSSGTFSIEKTTASPNTIQITIISVLGTTPTVTVSVGCPVGNPLNVTSIVLTNNSDTGKYINSEYFYTESSYTSPLTSNFVEFQTNTTNQTFSSLYSNVLGVKGFGSFPITNSTVTIRSNKISPIGSFDVDIATDKFKFLSTNTLYSNTESDLQLLINAIDSAGAGNTLTPSGVSPIFNASFTMPNNTNTYLYLVWDFRTATDSLLCFDAANIENVCCDCSCSTTNQIGYTIVNTGATTISVAFTPADSSSSPLIIFNGGTGVVCSSSVPVITPTNYNDYSITITDCSCLN